MLRVKSVLLSVSLLLVLELSHVPQTSAVLDDVLDVIHIGKEVAAGVLQAWNIVEQTNLHEQIDLPITREKHKKVLRRLKELSRQIELTESKHVNTAAWTIESVNNYVKMNTQIELVLLKIHDIINSITVRFKQMKSYAKHRDKFENSTILTFAEWTVSPNPDAINHNLESLHLLYTSSEELRSRRPGVLKLMAQNLKIIGVVRYVCLIGQINKRKWPRWYIRGTPKRITTPEKSFKLYRLGSIEEDSNDQICATKQSPQQFLFSLYNDISLTELKGYAMMQFSWMILNIYGKGNFTHEAQLMRSDFEKRTNETQRVVREVMRRADRILWTCDPPVYIKGETYDEVTRLLQGYIENEVDMNPDQSCRENCNYYGESKSHGCFKDLYCSRQPRCTGKLYSCQFFDSDMWICPASDRSNRRYEYIEYENGRILGKAGHCVRGTTKVDSWWRWLFWHCSYCFCLCDEQGIKSDRYFNLRETVSDIENNMIVTGLRFVKKNRVFHLQIQEGQLQPRGNIDDATLRWKSVDSYQIFDHGINPGIDYHTLTYANRALDLDDITSENSKYLVTGVKFRVVGAHLNLEVRLTEFDFETGKLVEPAMTSHWISNDNTDVSGDRRVEIKLKSPDVPANSQVKSRPTSSHNQFIQFVNTDMDKDASQTTVPFIDIQNVESNPPVPLSGIGIYHKGIDHYGGFVAPKLITYDFAPHIQTPKFDQ